MSKHGDKHSLQARRLTRRSFGRGAVAIGALAASRPLRVSTALAAEPIKIGFGMAQSGPLGGNGKAALLAIQMWRDDINGRGGLLGRPVQLIYYDDQTNPALIPGIYSKLFDIDKVDLVLGGYGTAVQAAALPIVMQHKQVLIGTGAVAANEKFNYDKYFQMLPNGSTARTSTSEGFFEAAMTMEPKPKTAAIVAALTEFSHNVILGARENAEKFGLKLVYDGGYPPNQVEFGTIMRSIQAANPEVVFVASYPPDSAGIIRAAYEQKLQTRMFGGAMIGLQYAELKQQLGPMLNDVLCYEFYVPAPTTNFPGIKQFLATYQERAKTAGADLLGFYLPPYAYAGMQVLEQAVKATNGLEPNAIGSYIHATTFDTVVGKVSFAANGDWAKPRLLYVQYRGIVGNDLAQFKEVGTQVIVSPQEFASGKLHYPFAATRG
ncbi:MAG TPA: amino acid ABC transporter substrate-binding protein [Xanthobacteraceae bacterium]|nr:amino acid ABC transporter substrate-binding protein [Xanthobacteraceae bacterium]